MYEFQWTFTKSIPRKFSSVLRSENHKFAMSLKINDHSAVLVMTVSNEKKIVNLYNVEILALVGATQKERFDYR